MLNRIPTDAVERELAKRGLARWCRYVDSSYEVAAHHARLIKALEAVERGEIRRLIVSMPPRHGKSLTTTIRFPSWFLGRNPHKRVIVASYADDLAYGFSRSCRDELSEYGKDVFGVEIARGSSAVGTWNLSKRRGGLSAAGVGGPITGKGCSLMVIDDPIKDSEQALSEVIRNKVHEWWRQVGRTRLAPRGCVVLVMTRWHEDDLAGRLLAEAKRGGEQWETLVLPMVDDSKGGETDSDGKVKLLWPEWFGDDYGTLDKLKQFKVTLGSRTWESLYQQRPAPQEGNRFKREWFRFYKPTNAPTWWRPLYARPEGCITSPPVELPPVGKLDEIIESWDFTFKATDGTDFVCGLKVARRGADKFLLSCYHKRATFTESCKALAEMRAEEPHATETLVEDKANGPAILNALGSRISGLVAVEPMGSKEARAASVEPQVEAGNVYLPDGAEWVIEFVEEVCAFPNAAHDDFVDALSQALIRLGEDADTANARALCGV